MKTCRVSFRELSGIEHSCEVDAGSVYEAVGFAMAKFKRSMEIECDITVASVDFTVEAREPAVTHIIPRKRFSDWLERTGGAPRDVISRQKVRESLGEPKARARG